MDNKNFIFGIKAISSDIYLFMINLIFHSGFVWFLGGMAVAIIVSGFIITKNPKQIPAILRHSSYDAFQKIAEQDSNGTYQMAYTSFVKMYSQTRKLFLLASIAFFTMVTVIVIFG